MTTSGVTSFTMTTTQLAEQAFRILGKLAEGEAMTPRMYNDGKLALNLILKTMGTQDRLWLRTERTVTLLADTAAYALSPKPGRVLSVRRRTSGIDVPMEEFARQTYFDQPNKTVSSSIPIAWYYDSQATTGTLYVWPAPSAATAASVTLNLTYLRRIEDMVNPSDELDMPQEWLQAIAWMMASDLETQYPVNDARLAQKIDGRARELMAELDSWDTENDSLYFQPDYMP